jgi:thiol:disulfide interchange protein
MGLLVWIMMGIAVWHFTVFFPDRFWAGIVGAFLVAIAGAVVFGLIANGGNVPGRDDTEIVQAILAIPGAALGLLASYLWGARQDEKAGIDHGQSRAGSH